jgi:V/A-type H+/Na+-transporting ATPase subunit K
VETMMTNMESVMTMLGWIGVFSPLALSAIGSVIGCTRSGQAACGAMLEIESGYGKYVGLSAMPSSMVIYGIVITLSLKDHPMVLQSEGGLFAIGVLAGLALLLCGVYQGYCCASAIHISKSKPEVFGLSITPAAIVEGFGVFTFVFALVLAGALPK